MNKLLYISDDNFFCAGLYGGFADSMLVDFESIMTSKFFIMEHQTPVVAVKNLSLRLQVIKKIQRATDNYIVILDEIDPRGFFKLGYVLYCGRLLSHSKISMLFSSNRKNQYANLTVRESEVLDNIHFQNEVIAKKMNLSAKTVSHYKLSILQKFNVTVKSNINMLRIKITLDEAFLSSIY